MTLYCINTLDDIPTHFITLPLFQDFYAFLDDQTLVFNLNVSREARGYEHAIYYLICILTHMALKL